MEFTDASSIMDKAAFLILTINKFGTKRKVSSSDFEIKADKTRIKANKTILVCKETEAIESFDAQTRKWIENHCLPFEQRGIHMTPLATIDETDAYLISRQERREELITSLLHAYPHVKQRDRQSLGDVFRESDYPSVAEVREAYQMRWRIVVFSTPGQLRSVNRAIFERERAKNAKLWAEAGAMADQFLHKSMAALVTGLIDKLTGKTGGKNKTIHKTTFANIQEFLSSFQPRNVNNNEELQELAERLKKAVDGVELDDLKKDQGTREYVRAKFEAVKKQLDTMLLDRPTRAISLRDEDDAFTIA
jgi:hypothetical protein